MDTGIMDTDRNWIDFHTHILPGMDDGSPDLETSEKMLVLLKQQGVHSVVLTPHFYSDRESLSDFLTRRENALAQLRPAADQMEIRIFPACELYFTDYIFNYSDLSSVCISSWKYLLTEFSFSCSFSETTLQKIEQLMASLNVIPILAHIERYPPLMKNQKLLTRLIEMGCLTQVNLSSLIQRGFLPRKAILNAIRDNLVSVVGTDCHNATTRPPDFAEGIQVIEKKIGMESVVALMTCASTILIGEH